MSRLSHPQRVGAAFLFILLLSCWYYGLSSFLWWKNDQNRQLLEVTRNLEDLYRMRKREADWIDRLQTAASDLAQRSLAYIVNIEDPFSWTRLQTIDMLEGTGLEMTRSDAGYIDRLPEVHDRPSPVFGGYRVRMECAGSLEAHLRFLENLDTDNPYLRVVEYELGPVRPQEKTRVGLVVLEWPIWLTEEKYAKVAALAQTGE